MALSPDEAQVFHELTVQQPKYSRKRQAKLRAGRWPSLSFSHTQAKSHGLACRYCTTFPFCRLRLGAEKGSRQPRDKVPITTQMERALQVKVLSQLTCCEKVAKQHVIQTLRLYFNNRPHYVEGIQGRRRLQVS